MRLRIVAAGLVLAACSGGGDAAPVTGTGSITAAPTAATTATTASTSVATTTGASPTTARAGGEGCPAVGALADLPVAEAVAQIPELSTLADAFAATGISPMSSDLASTVLAPTDSAFAAVPDLGELLESPERTTGMVTMHVIPSRRLSAADLAGIGILQHVGVDLSFTNDGGRAQVNGATIVCADVQTADATVHVIDAVLTPPIDEETVGGSQLYSVDLATGRATSLGAIGLELGVLGLAFAPDGSGQLYGLTDAAELITFDVSDPSVVTAVPISGVAGGSTLLAMEAGDTVMAVSDASVLYTIEATTGLATEVGDGINPPLTDPGVGFALTPRTNLARLAVATGENLPLNLSTGTVEVDPGTEQPLTDDVFVSADGAAPPRIVATAHEYGPTDAITLYGIDSAAGSLVRIEPVEEGVTRTVGSLGITVTDGASFDIGPDGTALLVVPG